MSFSTDYLQERFQRLSSKKILIYGTGKIAGRLLEALRYYNIVGVLDGIHSDGEFERFPILTWDVINSDTADVIILAATRKNYAVIFNRIQYKCLSLHIEIYGENGKNLTKESQMKYVKSSDMLYFEKNPEELKRLIMQYDAVSFGLMDTLVMSKILEPSIKDSFISRKVMVEIIRYAIEQRKKVSIISDICISSSAAKEILDNMGISGYDKLYTLYDYNLKNPDGLFEIYRKETGNVKCLYIGCSSSVDLTAPLKSQIDVYEIKSALEMLKISSLRKILIYADGINTSTAVGILLAELFNDPFVLYRTGGLVPISTLELFAKLFIAPVVLVYMQELMKKIQSGNYEKILFSARDGYLFKKIYDSFFIQKCRTPAVYFLTSRKLCLSSTLDSESDILNLCEYFPLGETLAPFLGELLGEKKELASNEEMEKYILSNSDKLKQYSAAMKKNYLKYMEKKNIGCSGQYLLCELVSHGTVQKSLNKLMSMDLDGFYLCKRCRVQERKINVSSVYDENLGNNIAEERDLLEIILTSPEPSVCAMDEDGNPVYSLEHRTKQELENITVMHNSIIDFIREYVELRNVNEDIGSELPEVIMGLCDSVSYVGDAKYLVMQENLDDISQRRIPVYKEL